MVRPGCRGALARVRPATNVSTSADRRTCPSPRSAWFFLQRSGV